MNRKFNYSLVCKLVFVSVVLSLLSSVSLVVSNVMFYQVYKTSIQKIDINSCSFEALDSLGGIGEIKANRIIENRPYRDIYELRSVIGETTFNAIKNQIKVVE